MGEIIFLIILLTMVLPFFKKNGTPRRFTDSGAKFYAPELQKASAATPAASQLSAPDRQTLYKTVLGAAAGIGGAALAVLMLVVLLNQAAENTWMLYSFDAALEYALRLAQYGLLAAVFGKVSKMGFHLLERVKNFRLYRDIISSQESCALSDIARASGRSVKTVCTDLEDMVRRGYFPYGFVDEQNACFYANNAIWRLQNPERAKADDARSLQRPGARAATAARRTAARTKQKLSGEASPGAQSAKHSTKHSAQPEKAGAEPTAPSDALEGQRFLRELQAQLAQVDDAGIHARVQEICERASAIFDWVGTHPECADDVHRFCVYYLPTTIKLLETYNQVEPHAESSAVAANIQKEVSDILEPVNKAFGSLLDNLLQNTAVDVSAEVSALQTVMAQDGLGPDALAAPAKPEKG